MYPVLQSQMGLVKMDAADTDLSAKMYLISAGLKNLKSNNIIVLHCKTPVYFIG